MGAFTREGRGWPKDSSAAKAYCERAAALGDEDAKKALKHIECPYARSRTSAEILSPIFAFERRSPT
jgi:hypothetical protein